MWSEQGGLNLSLSDAIDVTGSLYNNNNTMSWNFWPNNAIWEKYTDPLSGFWQAPTDPEALLQDTFIIGRNGSDVVVFCATDFITCEDWLSATGVSDGESLTLKFNTGAQLNGTITANSTSISLSNGTQWTQTPDLQYPTPIRTVHLIFMVCCCC